VDALLTIDEALALVLAHVRALPLEEVLVREAAGRVLGRAATAAADLPPFPSSAMDGYAVRAADTPGALAIVGHAAAGAPAKREVGPGEAVAISTGAVVPGGADAVVPVELTRRESDDGRVVVEAVADGANIRPRGGDVRAGEVVLSAGVALEPLQLGALAAAGVATVGCPRRPSVAVLATGSELRPPGTELAPGQIYESNSVLLEAQVRSAGAVAAVLETVGDDEEATRTALAHGIAEHDVLITSGGVSVGPHDLVRGELARLGVEEVFWRVAVKPGKPVAFGVHDAKLVFGLPGNPVSSLVGFELFVRPALRALQRAADPRPAYLPGALARPTRRDPARDQLLRARADRQGDAVVLEPLSGQDSHMIVRAAAAAALVLIPRGNGELAEGAPVRYLAL
jgi:molybdopterin molybdotransferase